jgi:type I restriction enzyme S subunit
MTSATPRKKLSELFTFKNGRGFSKSEWSSRGLPIIRIQNLNDANAPFNYFGGEYSDDILVEQGDLLFSWSGTVGSSFGSHLWDREKGVLNQHIFKITPTNGISKTYAYYGLRYITEEIEKSVSGAVGLVHITKARLNEFTLPVPPLTEQRRIVGILDEAFDGIATVKANAEKNLQNAHALFESLVDSIFGELSTKVAGKALADCVENISTGPFGSLLHKSDYEEGGIPLVNPINIDGDTIVPDARTAVGADTAKRLARYILREGDVVTARRGEIGRCAVVTAEQDGWLCGTGSFFIRPACGVDSRFLTHLLRSRLYRSQLERLSSRATMPSIGNDDLANLIVHVPSAERQRQIEAKLRWLAEQLNCLESIYQRKLAALDELKKSLLHQAFSGQL